MTDKEVSHYSQVELVQAKKQIQRNADLTPKKRLKNVDEAAEWWEKYDK